MLSGSPIDYLPACQDDPLLDPPTAPRRPPPLGPSPLLEGPFDPSTEVRKIENVAVGAGSKPRGAAYAGHTSRDTSRVTRG